MCNDYHDRIYKMPVNVLLWSKLLCLFRQTCVQGFRFPSLAIHVGVLRIRYYYEFREHSKVLFFVFAIWSLVNKHLSKMAVDFDC